MRILLVCRNHMNICMTITGKSTCYNKNFINLNTLRSIFGYRNLLEIKEKAEITLNTAIEWQNEQREREAVINKKISMQTEHIKYRKFKILVSKLLHCLICNFTISYFCSTLLEDRQMLISKNNDMLKDMLILRRELENQKNGFPRSG